MMLLLKLFLLFCYCRSNCLVKSTDVKLPGVRSLLTSRGINYVRKIAVPIIVKELNHLKIPVISGKVDLYFTHIKYNFTKIKLSQVQIPDSYISVVNNRGLLVKADHLTFKLNDLWNYGFDTWPFISDSGSCVVSGKRISLKLLLGVDKGKKEELYVDASNCALNIGDLDIAFHGGTGSWLYNVLISVVKDMVKNDIQKLICKTATDVVNKKMNDALKTIPDEERYLNNTIKTEVDLVDLPSFTEYGLGMNFRGEFYNVKHPVKAPYSPPLLPPLKAEVSNMMMYLWCTSYTLNTALFAVYQTGMMYTTIFKKDLPSSIPVSLETNSFIFVVPPLYDKYPDKDMAIGVNATSPPRVIFGENEGTLTDTANITFFVFTNERFLDCFTLNAKIKLRIERTFVEQSDNNTYLGFTFSSVQIDTSLLESRIGKFDLDLLQFTIDVLAQFFVTRYLTDWARRGIILPVVQSMELYNSKSVMQKNYILLSTDFRSRR